MSATDRYDYDIVVNLPGDMEKTVRGSCYGAEYMVQAIEQHYPDYTSAVITFVIKRNTVKASQPEL